MIHFFTRKHLLDWLILNCTRKTVVRAMGEGAIEHLGAFIKLGPHELPGWIVKVTSNRGKSWYVEAVKHPTHKRYCIFVTQNSMRIPWEQWDGGDGLDPIAGSTPMPLYDGDNPIEYGRLRDERRRKIESQDSSFERTKPGTESATQNGRKED